MNKIWRIKPTPQASVSESLAKAINVNPFLAKLLVQRNIVDFDIAKAYFRPSLDMLHDPFLMRDMDKAVDRLTKAIISKEKILVFGDYDVDGTTSVASVYHFLKNHTGILPENLAFYIPDRYGEGYGISTKGIDYASENGFSLIISLDCGIKSIEKIDYASSKNIDFIICDHHNPGVEIPKAYAVLDPKRADCQYPYKELSGCGVGFKFLQAYCITHQISTEKLYPYLDLLCVSIAADIVPMTGENRIFSFHGLKKINENPRPGLRALGAVAGFKKELNISNVVFGFAPRINAAGRIAHAHGAVELLLADNEAVAIKFADGLNENNLSRKDFDSSITLEAIEMIEEQENFQALKSTVLFKSDWHKGVVGIVASRCIEKYYRPTIIFTESNGKATGSARSVDGFDVYEAICACSDLLEQFGGHTHAAGMTLELKNIDAFKARFEEVVSARIAPDQLIPKINIDVEVGLDFASQKTFNIIKQMEPFGPGNMTPVFLTQKLLPENPRIVGEKHLKFGVKMPNSNIKKEAIAWGMADYFEILSSLKPIDICYSLSENTFNNITAIELNIKDIRFSRL
ncbi:MAG: single-stranded-DNA-specific exonuclease RecJ [Cytophagales bacterium]